MLNARRLSEQPEYWKSSFPNALFCPRSGVAPGPQRIPPRSFRMRMLLNTLGESERMSIPIVRLSKNVQFETSALEPSSVTSGDTGTGILFLVKKQNWIFGVEPGAQ